MEDRTSHAEGIVLATTDFGDDHRVVTIFTKEFGKLDANAYGARRARSRLAAPTLMFNYISVEILHGPKVDVIRNAEIIEYFPITEDLFRIGYASLLFEIVNRLTPLAQKDEDVFFILLNSLRTFVQRNPRIVSIIAIAQFIAVSGELLRLDRCVRCGRPVETDCAVDVLEGGALCDQCCVDPTDVIPLTLETRNLIDAFIAFDWNDQSHLTLRAEPLFDAEDILIAHIRALVDYPLRSLKFLRQLRAMPAPSA